MHKSNNQFYNKLLTQYTDHTTFHVVIYQIPFLQIKTRNQKFGTTLQQYILSVNKVYLMYTQNKFPVSVMNFNSVSLRMDVILLITVLEGPGSILSHHRLTPCHRTNRPCSLHIYFIAPLNPISSSPTR